MLTPREISMSREILHLKLLLRMAQDTIEVQRRTSDRFWATICDLWARMGD